MKMVQNVVIEVIGNDLCFDLFLKYVDLRPESGNVSVWKFYK